MTARARRRLVVTGRVQNVWFRDTARREAERRSLAGYARNRPDGAVEMEVEGEPADIDDFVAWARTGPPRARVDELEVSEISPAGGEGFSIS